VIVGDSLKVRFASILLGAVVLGGSGVTHAQDMDACIAASDEAVLLRKSERLMEARVPLATCAAPSCPDIVRSSCQQRLAGLNQEIPSIVFVVKDGAGHDLDAVKLMIDGSPYADRLGGVAVSLDPGEHEFRFETAGEVPVIRRFVLHQSEQNRREPIVIGGPFTTPPTVPEVAAPPGTSSRASMDRAVSSHGRAQRTIGLVAGGVGLVALGAGAVFGLLSLSAHQSYEQNCGSKINAPAGFCTQTGVDGESDAATKGTLSTIFFIGGGALTAAGGVLFLVAPKGTVNAQVGVAPGGIAVRGWF
jgi:hypothetical protein